MNTNNVISAEAAGDLTGQEYKVVKFTSTGIDLATDGDDLTVVAGTLLRAQPVQEDGVYAGKAVAVQLKAGSKHYAMLGATTDPIAVGDALEIDSGNAGQLVPANSGGIALSLMNVTGVIGAVIEVVFVEGAVGATGTSGSSGYSGFSGA